MSGALALADPYTARLIASLGVWEYRDWRLKLYGIRCSRPTPPKHAYGI
jgi:hypothetical protein